MQTSWEKNLNLAAMAELALVRQKFEKLRRSVSQRFRRLRESHK